MKKGISLVLFCSLALWAHSQKVGIGTPTPEMALHVETPDSNVLQLSSSTPLDENISMGLYLKNGDWYTGALRTVGAATNAARLGLFTFATTDPATLKERLSISDGGNVGINNTSPTATLHVTGNQKIQNNGTFLLPALDVSSSLSNNIYVPGINVQAASTGIVTGTTNAAGGGLMAWNGQLPAIQAGTAITAHSTNGNAIYAQSIKTNGISILGNSSQPTVTAARFQNSGGGKALVTSGLVQIEGQGAGAGKVLTSDASGNATWQETGTKVAFRGYLAANILLSPTSIVPVTGITSIANDGNGLNSNAGDFTAPAAGWYQFTVNTQFYLPNASMRMALDLLRNGNTATGMTSQFLIGTDNSGQLDSRNVTQLIKLNAGDVISFQYRHVGGTGTINIFGQGAATNTTFHGVKL